MPEEITKCPTCQKEYTVAPMRTFGGTIVCDDDFTQIWPIIGKSKSILDED